MTPAPARRACSRPAGRRRAPRPDRRPAWCLHRPGERAVQRIATFMRSARSSACRHRRSPSRPRPGWSATSWCCAARSSPATRSATSRSPARSAALAAGIACGSACTWRASPCALAMAALGTPRPGRRRGDRQRVRLGAGARRAVPVDLHHIAQAAPTAPPASSVLFGSIFGLSGTQAVTDTAAVIALAVVRRDPRDRPGRCCSPASTRRSPARAGAGPDARVRVPRPGRRHRRRGHPGGRRAAAPRPPRRSGRRGPAADRPPVPRDVAVGRHSRSSPCGPG